MKSLEFDWHFSSEDDCERFLKEHREKYGITYAICSGKRHCWTGAEEAMAKSERQTVPGKDTTKVLPWVDVTIANTKSLLRNMYHGVNRELLQLYLNEFCYKLNRVYFGGKTFDRLVIATVKYRSEFKHIHYKSSPDCG